MFGGLDMNMVSTRDFTDHMETSTTLFADTDDYTRSFPNLTTESSGAYVKPFYKYDIFLKGRFIYSNGWKLIVPPGLVGNIIIILATMKMKPFNSTRFFMISLAIVDLSLNILRIPFKEVRFTSTSTCKAMWYLYNVLPVFSNYILVAWTLERVIAVQFPLRAGDWCTVRRAALAVATAGIFSFAIMVPWPIAIVGTSVNFGCKLQADMIYFINNIWNKVDSSVFVYIPMIIIFLSNFLIITRLHQSTKRHKKMTSSEESKRKREKEQRNTSISLIAVCIAFVVLHMPLAVYNCFALTPRGNAAAGQEELAVWQFLNLFGLTMMELQNSVNFYLYFLVGKRYRQVTASILFPCRRGAKGQRVAESTAVTGISVVSETSKTF